VLWSEEIRLSRANPLQRLSQDWKKPESIKPLPKANSSLTLREKRQFQRGIWGGAVLCLLLLVVGGLLYNRLGLELLNPLQTSAIGEREATEAGSATEVDGATEADGATSNPNGALADASTDSPTSTQPSSEPSDSTAVAAQEDPFAQAVRLAEQAAADGQAAQSSADWLDLATRWQRASDLMAEVPAADGRYKTAQDRMKVYRLNSEAALQQAQIKRTQADQPIQPAN